MATSIKISQLPAKGANLEATDLLEVSEFNGTGYVSKSITGQEIIDSIPSASVAWGGITGTLSAQTDLNTALSGKVPTTRTLTINGTTQDLSADRTFTISTGITIGTTAITSGTVGRVLFEGTGNVVQQSANITWDNTNNIFNVTGLIKATQNNIHATHVGANIKGLYIVNNSDSVVRAGLQFDGSTAFVELVGRYNNGTPFFRQDGGNGNISFLRSGSEYGRIFGATGNWGINTTTDGGFKLDVSGTARVSTSILVGAGATQGTIQTGVFRGTYFNDYANNFTIFQVQSNGNASFYQGLAIGTSSNAVASAQVEIVSTTKGFLPPRMTTTQKNAIASPATGLMVYDTTLNLISVYNGTTWISL